MGFIAPLAAGIAAAVAVPALVSLYFLKLKRKRMVIPSTLLWQKAVQDLQVNAPFQKIKNNLLLWVQLLLLVLLLLAMARPTQNLVADPGRRVVILIDCSASMNSTDADEEGTTRLDAAKERALQIVDALDAGGTGDDGAGAMVVAFSHRAVVMQDFTTDLARVRRAIRDIEPTDQASYLDAAITAIEPHARQGGGEEGLVVHIFSDGRVSDSASEPMSIANTTLRYHRVGLAEASGDNLAIAALSARRHLDNPQVVQVYSRLANFGPAPVTTRVSFLIDGTVAATRSVTVPALEETATGDAAPGEAGLTFEMTQVGDAVLTVRHDHRDLLLADNAARTVLAPSRQLRVLMVTTGNGYLELACNAADIDHLVQMTPAQYEQQDPQRLRFGGWDPAQATGDTGEPGEGFDVVIYDRYAPQHVPLVSSLYFDAVPPLDGLELRETRPESPDYELITQWDRSSELLRNVELSDIPLRRPGRLVVPSDGQVLAIAREGPVMAEVIREGVRHVVVSFDIYQSLWPHRISFPVFIQNVMPTLGLDGNTQEAGLAYRTGENAVVLAEEDLRELTYEGPVQLGSRAVGTTFNVDAFPRVGLYETEADVSLRDQRLAVNLLNAAESDPRTVEVLAIGTSSVEGQAQSVEVRQEVWHWFVWGALAVLLLEWMIYARRMHI